MAQTQILMLPPDAFCEHTMQPNATAAGALPRTPLEELTALPQTSYLILRGPLRNTPEMAITLQPSDAKFGYRGGGKGREEGGGEEDRKGKEKERGGAEEGNRGEGEGTWNRAADWLRLALLRRGVFTCVGWQVTLCDLIWQVTSRSSRRVLVESFIHL